VGLYLRKQLTKPVTDYIPVRALLIEGVVDRGVRTAEQGAVPDNGIAVEPREAQRPTSLAARTP
jgi:hypothetical protein